jgi:uncharacterized membrane protein YczE
VLFGLAMAVLVQAGLVDPWTVFHEGVAEHVGLSLGTVTVISSLIVLAILATAVATGLYVGAGWGPGPRDGLMTGLHRRGVPLAAARAGIELTVQAAGWLLGGTVGLATVLFALTIGALVKPALQHLAVR